MGSAANAVLVHLEPMERVCWLQMSFFPLGGNVSPLNHLAEFEPTLRREKDEKRKGREGKGWKATEGMEEDSPEIA